MASTELLIGPLRAQAKTLIADIESDRERARQKASGVRETVIARLMQKRWWQFRAKTREEVIAHFRPWGYGATADESDQLFAFENKRWKFMFSAQYRSLHRMLELFDRAEAEGRTHVTVTTDDLSVLGFWPKNPVKDEDEDDDA